MTINYTEYMYFFLYEIKVIQGPDNVMNDVRAHLSQVFAHDI